MPKTTKKVEETASHSKSCPLDNKTCEKVCHKTKLCCSKIETFVKNNYKKPIFIASCMAALLVLICLVHCNKDTTKFHFSKAGIIKEVTSGDDSKYYFCKRDFPEGELEKNKFYISCKTQVVEN